jgi:hypothetical protein
MFDSPFDFCRICNGYVLLDQTQPQCAREHACAERAQCPLARFFTGFDFAKGEPATSSKSPRPHGRSRGPAAR